MSIRDVSCDDAQDNRREACTRCPELADVRVIVHYLNSNILGKSNLCTDCAVKYLIDIPVKLSTTGSVAIGMELLLTGGYINGTLRE